MLHDTQPGDVADRASRPPRLARVITRALLSLGFSLFVAGGLYFGYIFVTTSVSLLTGNPRPQGVTLLPSNPFQPSVSGAQPSPTMTLPTWQGDDRLNILLLGIDQREDERGQPSRTDTMIVITVDPIAKDASLLAIPRDLWVAIPGHGENKVNTAHFYGEWDRPGSGPSLAKQTVEQLLGIRVHYYARVDFTGFENMIDNVGGVIVDAPKPVKDDEYPEGDYGIRRIYIPAGLQHMDGKTALQYARSRHSDNDIGRAQRQLQVLAAAKSQAMRLDLLPKLPFLLGSLRNAVSTDVSASDTLALFNLMRQIDTKNVQSRAIDWAMMNDLYGDGTVLIPKQDAIRKVVAELFMDSHIRGEAATIAVQNGTMREGLAASMGGFLNSRAFTVRGVSQAVRSDYRETIIIDHTGKPHTTQKLAELLNVPKRNQQSSPGVTTDITIILGADAKLP